MRLFYESMELNRRNNLGNIAEVVLLFHDEILGRSLKFLVSYHRKFDMVLTYFYLKLANCIVPIEPPVLSIDCKSLFVTI